MGLREIMLILHFIGLAMGVGTSFAMLFSNISSKKMDKTTANDFMLKMGGALSKMGLIGIFILIGSGSILMMETAAWKGDHWFYTKLLLVLILTGLAHVIPANIKKAQKGDEKALAKAEKIGKISFSLALLIIILAVSIFK
ncbi:MAG: hypothetical protein H6607_12040 [Flavobacteriales bacterium]|nr:hypothetical protein [Flavobacteriales bacterium]